MTRTSSITAVVAADPRSDQGTARILTMNKTSRPALTHPKVANTVSNPRPIPGHEEVRVVTATEYKEAAACLAEAFIRDDVARYFLDVPDRPNWTEEDKWAIHCAILEYMTHAHCLKGLVTTIGPNYDAVALWMPPKQNMDDFLTILRSGLWRLHYQLSPEGRKRFFEEFLPLLHDTKLAALGERDEDSWYLVYLGTRPSARRNGYARKLVEHVAKQADAEGRACYLESSNAINPRIYEKMGFQVHSKIVLERAEAGVPLEIMIREPAAQ